jgi:hypothetical protein
MDPRNDRQLKQSAPRQQGLRFEIKEVVETNRMSNYFIGLCFFDGTDILYNYVILKVAR